MELITRAHGEHAFGYTPMAEMNGVHAEMLMDFGVLRMRKGDRVVESQPLEKAYLLVYGKVRFTWEGKAHEQERENCFDVPPTALHVCKDVQVTLECLSEECEIDILRTDNEKAFPSKLYLPEDTPDEFRGAGTMHETSTRIVRTIFDNRNAPYANLVLGEVGHGAFLAMLDDQQLGALPQPIGGAGLVRAIQAQQPLHQVKLFPGTQDDVALLGYQAGINGNLVLILPGIGPVICVKDHRDIMPLRKGQRLQP